MSTLTPAASQSGDRLTFTLFVAAAVHAILILGITFDEKFGREGIPSLDVTLTTQRSSELPDHAEFLAQHNQEASGDGHKTQELTTDQQAQIADTVIRQAGDAAAASQHSDASERASSPVTTVGESQFSARLTLTAEEQQENLTKSEEMTLQNEIASLRAKLDRQRQALGEGPRVKRITSVAAKGSPEAAYLFDWTQRIERVGNENFPPEAIAQRLIGSLRLAVTLTRDGAVSDVELLQGSGHALLDEAALRIVRMASPFAPFPEEIGDQTDKIEIIRTWHFELTGVSARHSGS